MRAAQAGGHWHLLAYALSFSLAAVFGTFNEPAEFPPGLGCGWGLCHTHPSPIASGGRLYMVGAPDPLL